MSSTLRRSTVLVALATALLLSLLLLTAVSAADARPVSLDGVRTSVTLDPATLQVLLGAGIVPFPVAPSPVAGTPTSLKYSFPVTGGRVDSKTLAGKVYHSGGLLLVKWNGTGWDALKLTRYTVNIGAQSFITAKVNDGARARILEVDLSSAKIKKYVRHGRSFVNVSGAKLALNATSIGAINATFGTALPTDAAIPFGTANLLLRVALAAH